MEYLAVAVVALVLAVVAWAAPKVWKEYDEEIKKHHDDQKGS